MSIDVFPQVNLWNPASTGKPLKGSYSPPHEMTPHLKTTVEARRRFGFYVQDFPAQPAI